MNPWALLLLGLACMVLYQIVTGALWSVGHPLIGLVAAPIAGVLVPVWGVARRLGLRARRELRLGALPARSLACIVWILISALPAAYALNALNSRLFQPAPELLGFYRLLIPQDAISFVGGLLGVVILAPLAEEVVFRGLVLGVLLRHLPVPVAILLSGVLFSAAHGSPWLLLPIAFLGVLLGVVTWITRSLSAAWLGHALFNLAAYLELSLTGDVASSHLEEWVLDPLVWAVSVVSFGAGLVGLARLRSRHERTRAPGNGLGRRTTGDVVRS